MLSGIWCPIPRIPNGSMHPRNAQRYEGTITLTCDRGFHINETNTGEIVLKCESGGKFLPDVTCFSKLSTLFMFSEGNLIEPLFRHLFCN